LLAQGRVEQMVVIMAGGLALTGWVGTFAIQWLAAHPTFGASRA
jgi:hypothetical protein